MLMFGCSVARQNVKMFTFIMNKLLFRSFTSVLDELVTE
jgi:hypothetical protein